MPLLPAPNASPKDPSLSTTPLLYCPQLLAKEQQVALLQKELREVDGLLQQLDTAGGGASGGRDQQQPQQGLPVLALKKAEVGRRPASPIQGKIVMTGRVCLYGGSKNTQALGIFWCRVNAGVCMFLCSKGRV